MQILRDAALTKFEPEFGCRRGVTRFDTSGRSVGLAS
jgi:hypothetical protein